MLIENCQKASRAVQNAIAGHRWPEGGVFEVPGLKF